MLLKLIFISLSFLLASCGGHNIKKDTNQIVAPYDGVRFNNLEPFPDKSFFDVLKWRFSSAKNAKAWPEHVEQLQTKPKAQRSQELLVTVIGHSSVLIQIDDINIITDPHFSERASPVSFAGPKRVAQPAIKIEDLPPIDYVLISHNHYDHLDLPSLKKLHNKFKPQFLVPLGDSYLLESEGIKNISEMDWWEFKLKDSLKIHFVPVQHWSARGIFDKRKSLWGGFVVEGTQKIFFAGDTGYGKVFKQIEEKLGPMDLSLIPIGAYEPRFFMKNAHINPDEAVKIFLDTKSSKALGIHFKTFAKLTDEYIDRPEKDLKKALEKYNIALDRFIAPEFGKSYAF
jgi:L-ascorbate metabolism protein UlaG (beta-lactamase superfamily)